MSPSPKKSPKFKHAPHTAWRQVNDEVIVLDLKSSVYYSLNDSASELWQRLAKGATVSDVVEHLCAVYDVPQAQAEKDAEHAVGILVKEKLLVEA